MRYVDLETASLAFFLSDNFVSSISLFITEPILVLEVCMSGA